MKPEFLHESTQVGIKNAYPALQISLPHWSSDTDDQMINILIIYTPWMNEM